MRGLVAALLLLAPAATPAAAGLTARDLAAVHAEAKPGATLPLSADLHDVAGQDLTLGDALAGLPTLLVPVDYTCRALCGPALALLGPLLSATRLRPGRDYTLLVLGVDPRDGPEAARAMTVAQLGPAARQPGIRVLTAPSASLDRIFGALAYRTAYDADRDRYAHPAAAFALSRDGTVVRTLSTLALDATDLDLALTEAGGGHAGNLSDRLVLLCYGFDPVQGVYTPRIRQILAAGGAMTLLGLAGAILALLRRSRRGHEAPS